MPAPSLGSIRFGELVRFARFVERSYRQPTTRNLLFSATGLRSTQTDEERRVPIELAFDLWAGAARATQAPALPIEFARQTRAEDFGVLGLLAMTSASGEEVMARVTRYHRLLSDAGRWTIHRERTRLVVRWERAGERSLGHRLANETVLAEFVAAARTVFGEIVPRAVLFRHRAPLDTESHRDFFAAPIRWSEAHDELHLPPDLLTAVPPRAEPAIAAWFAGEAERKLVALSNDSLAARVRAALDLAMIDGEPTLSRITRELGTSERSLRRHLAAERTSFRGLLDLHRRERAKDLLTDKGARMTDVAFLLGFSEASAFARAYRRWFGRAPAKGGLMARTPTR